MIFTKNLHNYMKEKKIISHTFQWGLQYMGRSSFLPTIYVDFLICPLIFLIEWRADRAICGSLRDFLIHLAGENAKIAAEPVCLLVFKAIGRKLLR